MDWRLRSVQNMNDTTNSALAWAQARKKDNESAMVARCPCCNELIAIYVAQSARQETVPDTNLAIPELVHATDDTQYNSRL